MAMPRGFWSLIGVGTGNPGLGITMEQQNESQLSRERNRKKELRKESQVPLSGNFDYEKYFEQIGKHVKEIND